MKSIYIHQIEEKDLGKYIDEVKMSDRDREVVRRYLEDKPTYRKLAELFGISHERVRQVIERFARKAHYKYQKENKEVTQ